MSDEVGRQPQYEAFADAFLEHARDGFANAHYDRPACLSLLGDVAGKRVLDAACGPGLYATELVRRGAHVTGFDQSPRMVEICRERVSQGDFRVHDLADPIDWLPDASVDLVLFALAIEYVDDRVAALRELRRILRPDGALVLSRLHPTGDWLRHGATTGMSGSSTRPGSRTGRCTTGWPRLRRPARRSSRRDS
jgi:ubiquinone/menaquinone biosynthesis C-methylase UbiE